MAKITIDELSVELKNLLAGTVGDGAELSSLGKKIIAEHFGTPLEPTHTFEEICDVIDNIIDEFKLNLASKGVMPNPDDKIKELVDKVLDIEGRELLYLYNEGDECEDATGGWYGGQLIDTTATDMGGTFTKKLNMFELVGSNLYAISHNNKIDVTGYNKLYVKCDRSGVGAFNLVVSESRFVQVETDARSEVTGDATNDILELDISKVSGEKYITLFCWKKVANIYQVWLEKESEKINKDNMIELLNNEGIEADSSETADELLYKLENDLIEAQKEELRNILLSKNIEINESEITLSNLIQKVNEFDDIDMTKLWLYRKGNAYENITGGFGITWVDTYGSGSTCTMKSDNIEIVYIANDGNYKAATASMLNPIDLTSYKTINIVYTCEGFGSLSLCAANGTGVGTDILASTSIKNAGTNLTASVDISSITGTKYIKFYGWGVSSRTSTLNVYKLWLEK